VNMRSTEGDAPCYSFPLDVFERAILSKLREVNPRELLGRDEGPDELKALENEFAAVQSAIKAIEADLDAHGESRTLYRRLREKEARQAELAKLLDAAQQKAANPLSEAWGEFRSLTDALDAAPDLHDARLRLRSALRRVVDSIWLLVVPRGQA